MNVEQNIASVQSENVSTILSNSKSLSSTDKPTRVVDNSLLPQAHNGIAPKSENPIDNKDIVSLKHLPMEQVVETNEQDITQSKDASNTFNSWRKETQDKSYVTEQLKNNWLAESERMIEKYYGLKAEPEHTLFVTFDDDPEAGYLASLGYKRSEDDKLGRATDQVLTIVTEEFPQGQSENGGYKPFYSDRTVAHEMVHAVMGQTMDMDTLGTWFKEGTAEFIHGGDERVYYQLSKHDGNLHNGYDNQDIEEFSQDVEFFDDWQGTSKEYAQSYIAVRFLHDDIVNHGGKGIKDVMSFLTDEKMLATGNATVDNALAYLSTYDLSSFSSEDELKQAYQNQSNIYIQNMNLTNEDTGAIGGYDSDRGEVKTAETVVNNSTKRKSGPFLSGYANVEFPNTSTISAVG